MTDLVIRPLAAGEEHVFDLLATPALVGPAAFGRSYRRRAGTHEDRPERTLGGVPW